MLTMQRSTRTANGSDLWGAEDDQPFTLDDEEDEEVASLPPDSPSQHSSHSALSGFSQRRGYAPAGGLSAPTQVHKRRRRGNCRHGPVRPECSMWPATSVLRRFVPCVMCICSSPAATERLRVGACEPYIHSSR